jgi:hypothetical protein
MVFGSRQMLTKVPGFRLPFLGKELVPRQTIKDLGVKFDPILSFDTHTTSNVSSCMSKLGQINRLKHAFNSTHLTTIIHMLVFIKLFYRSSVWSTTSVGNIGRLQHVQNFAARIISGTRKFDHIIPVLKTLRWLPVKTQLYLRDSIYAFKCMTDRAPGYLTMQLITRQKISGRVTRNSQQLNIPRFRTATGQKSFSYRIISIWNSLDRNLKLCNDTPAFKRNLKKKLLGQFLES